MKIGGWQKVSLIEYPAKISTILFTQGCNFRCPYCHNPELVDAALFKDSYSQETIFAYLAKRQGLLDAVSVTGGEPTIQPDLVDLITRIKNMGYLVKLDTNGTQPGVLQGLFEQSLLDYIAMDIKAPLDRYEEIVRVAVVQEDILKSIRMVMNSGIPYEFRTTVVEPLISMEDFKQIGKMIKDASLYILQKYIPSKPLDVSYITSAPPSDQTLAAAKALLEQDVQTVMIR